MPRRQDAVITPNIQLSDARRRFPSPMRPAQCLSRAELADAVNVALDRLYAARDMAAQYVDARWVGKLERGEHRWPSAERRAALRHVLGATDAEIGLYSPRRTESVLADSRDGPTSGSSEIDTLDPLSDLGSVDVDSLRRHLLRAAASTAVGILAYDASRPARPAARRATSDDADAVREMAQMFSRADQRRGGGHGRAAVTQYLHTDVVGLLAADSDERTRRRLLSAAAEVAYLTGWMAFDDSDHAAARRYLSLAARLAREADDHALTGHILRALAHQALDLSQPQQALELATAAIDAPRYAAASPRERALIGVVHARALAAAGSPQVAAGALIRAENDLRAAEVGDDEPTRVFFFTEAALAHETARTLHLLGDYSGARDQFKRSVRLRQASHFARTHAVTLGYLGTIYAETGEIEQAGDTWGAALDAMSGVRSGRTRQTAANIRMALRPWLHHVPAVRHIDERAAIYLTTA